MKLYEKIREMWELAGGDIEKPPHLQSLDDGARLLDQQLGEEFRGPIQQWQDGLIASVELLDKLVDAGWRDR